MSARTVGDITTIQRTMASSRIPVARFIGRQPFSSVRLSPASGVTTEASDLPWSNRCASSAGHTATPVLNADLFYDPKTGNGPTEVVFCLDRTRRLRTAALEPLLRKDIGLRSYGVKESRIMYAASATQSDGQALARHSVLSALSLEPPRQRFVLLPDLPRHPVAEFVKELPLPGYGFEPALPVDRE